MIDDETFIPKEIKFPWAKSIYDFGSSILSNIAEKHKVFLQINVKYVFWF